MCLFSSEVYNVYYENNAKIEKTGGNIPQSKSGSSGSLTSHSTMGLYGAQLKGKLGRLFIQTGIILKVKFGGLIRATVSEEGTQSKNDKMSVVFRGTVRSLRGKLGLVEILYGEMGPHASASASGTVVGSSYVCD